MTRVGIYFAVVQFLFVTCWTVYVIYLPQLAAQAGIEKKWVIYILMADQAIFTLMDFSIGVAADRVSRTLGRLGRMLVVLTAISCGALPAPRSRPMGHSTRAKADSVTPSAFRFCWSHSDARRPNPVPSPSPRSSPA